MSALDFLSVRRPATRPSPRRFAIPAGLRRWRVAVPLALVLALAIAGTVALARRGAADTQYRTAAATLGTVTQSLSLAGNLAPVGESDLSFGSSGRVLAVNVQAGQSVTAGQVLATLDTSGLQGALTQAQANLQSAQAKLSLDQAGPTPQNLAQAESALNTAQVGERNAQMSFTDTQAVNQQQTTAAASTLTAAQNAVNADQGTVNADQAALAADASSPQRSATDQQVLSRDQQTLTRDQSALDSAQSALSAAQLKAQQSNDQAQAQLNSARVSLSNAQLSLNALRQGAQPQTLQMDQNQVQIAQVGVDTAQRNLAQATLVAPGAGVVGQVNLVAGQSVSGGGSSGSASTGGSGSTGATGSSGSSGTASSGSSSGAGSSGAEIVVLAPGLFQVTGTVSDAQVGQLAVGQRARVLAAGSSEAVDGRVTQVSPQATITSGVATFAVTVTLDGTNPSLRSGMTATITVILNQAVHVLTVPTSAVHSSGGATTVSVLVNGSPQPRPVSTAAADALRTEIVSGLQEGDQVVIATLSSSIPSPGAGAGGFLGTGGGGRAGGAGGGTRTFGGGGGG